MVSDGQRKKRSESTSVLELSECLVVLSSIHMHSHGDLTQTPTLNTVCVITSVSLDWASWTFRFIHASGICYLTSELKRLIGLNLCSPHPASNPSSAFPITPSSKFILPDAQTKKKTLCFSLILTFALSTNSYPQNTPHIWSPLTPTAVTLVQASHHLSPALFQKAASWPPCVYYPCPLHSALKTAQQQFVCMWVRLWCTLLKDA